MNIHPKTYKHKHYVHQCSRTRTQWNDICENDDGKWCGWKITINVRDRWWSKPNAIPCMRTCIFYRFIIFEIGFWLTTNVKIYFLFVYTLYCKCTPVNTEQQYCKIETIRFQATTISANRSLIAFIWIYKFHIPCFLFNTPPPINGKYVQSFLVA